MTVWVRAPARIHLGVLDPSGSSGRWFAGLGVALEEPHVLVSATPWPQLRVDGPQAERVEAVLRRFTERYGPVRARITVHAALPPHVGLGSGTQLALAVAEAVCRLHGVSPTPELLAELAGRARRSGVGVWTYWRGGFVLEGGHGPNRDAGLPPLLVHHPLPDGWWFVLASFPDRAGPSGEEEERLFARLPPPPAGLTDRICRLVLLGLLPALVEGHAASFGAALSELQVSVGDLFAPVQGGRYAHPRAAELLDAMRAAGAVGGGQSSWGPTVYGLVEGEEQALRIARVLRSRGNLTVWASRPSREGRRVWRGPATDEPPAVPGADSGAGAPGAAEAIPGQGPQP